MAKRKTRIEHAEIVGLFEARLREWRVSRGMTQLQLARQAHVSNTYIGRLDRSFPDGPVLALGYDTNGRF